MSNAAGPNGPATLSCQRDLSALRADGPLYQDVKTLLGEGNLNYSIDDYEVEPGTWKHSKIVALSDKTGKTRIIAIGD